MVHAEPKLTLGSKEAMPAPREHAALEDIDGRLVLGTWWDRLPYGNPLSPITLNVPKKDDPDHALHHGYGAMRSGLGTGRKYTEAIIPLGDPRVECPGASWGRLDFVRIEVLNPEVVDESLPLDQQIISEGLLRYRISDTRGGEPVDLSPEDLYAYAATIKGGEPLKPVADGEEAQPSGPVVRGILFVSRGTTARSTAASRPSKFPNIYGAFDRRVRQQATTSNLGGAASFLTSMEPEATSNLGPNLEAERQGIPHEVFFAGRKESDFLQGLLYREGGPSEGLGVLVGGTTGPKGEQQRVTDVVIQFEGTEGNDFAKISVEDPEATTPRYTVTNVAMQASPQPYGIELLPDGIKQSALQVRELLTLYPRGAGAQRPALVKRILLYDRTQVPPKADRRRGFRSFVVDDFRKAIERKKAAGQ